MHNIIRQWKKPKQKENVTNERLKKKNNQKWNLQFAFYTLPLSWMLLKIFIECLGVCGSDLLLSMRLMNIYTKNSWLTIFLFGIKENINLIHYTVSYKIYITYMNHSMDAGIHINVICMSLFGSGCHSYNIGWFYLVSSVLTDIVVLFLCFCACVCMCCSHQQYLKFYQKRNPIQLD